eukprot:10693154-Alexandrium_andersonii.AAC.1
MYDADGTARIMHVGPALLLATPSKLDEAKPLYKSRVGKDVAAEPAGDGCKSDADCAAWAPPSS